MKKAFLLIGLLAIAVLPACKKEKAEETNSVGNSIDDIKVPDGFSWESSRYIDVVVNIKDQRFGNASHAIAVYDGNPYEGGNLLSKGSASTSQPYSNKLYIAKNISELYVMKLSPDSSRSIEKINANLSVANVSFPEKGDNEGNQAGMKAKVTAVSCTGCTTTITSSTNSVDVSTGNVICITGNNITVSFNNVTGGTIKVCGTNVTLTSLNMKGSATLQIASGATINSNSGINLDDVSSIQNEGLLSFTNFNMNSTGTVLNDGTITGPAIGMNKGSFINNGTYNFTGWLNVNSSMIFNNSGTINGQAFINNSQQVLTNNGKIDLSGDFTQNSSSPNLVNNCALIIGGAFTMNAKVSNYKLIKVAGHTNITGTNELAQYSLAMFQTNTLNMDGTIYGRGSNTALAKIAGNITGNPNANGNGKFQGNLQVCNSNINYNTNGSRLASGAAAGCDLYVATDNCNGTGNGTPTITDTDNDGVADNIDEYPNDPNKANNNYYPSSTGMATVAFEDQWPIKGDYDLNDLVMSYRYKIVTNASGKVVQVNGTLELNATGGSFPNGFGIEFPVSRSSVSGLTSGTLEAGQSKAVVILFTNMRTQASNWNTDPAQAPSAPETYSFTFNINNGPTLSNFGLSGYNPFIWNSDKGRGNEIHLLGQKPTDLANTSLFGTGDDNSSTQNERYYVTKTGLPYAIEVPVSPFYYPIEKADITQAYLKFADWAQSGGMSYVDWFSNTASGYRNTSNIFNPVLSQ
ncbi:MAG TPA: LruC domain-containing protein [Flavipsychrobacter sp.]|nr:LruC domain-containing protein [Flavipsychrobacter sp.]